MRKINLTIIGLLCLQIGFAQTIHGFWTIDNVQVGEEEMTPVAKWNRINTDGTFQSGNGWLQNGEGTWSYDEEKQLFKPETKYGSRDPFGAFKVMFDGDNMIWEREEEGMQVVVSLSRIEEMPKSPADWLQGLWGLTSEEDKFFYRIRWDRIYIYRDANGNRKTGYWHINGHRPEVTLLSHNPNEPAVSWRIEVGAEVLEMTGISDSNRDQVLVFERLDEFPN